MYKLFRSLVILTIIAQITKCIQLCNPYTQPYPCAACQPYAQLNNGLCQCKPTYYMVVGSSYQYCDLCHSSCKTCYGPLSTNCISCPTSFTFNSDSATCTAPNTATQSFILSAYSIQGFTKLTSWTMVNFATQTYQCGLKTLLGVARPTAFTTGNKIKVALSSLPNHFRIRIMAQFYFFGGIGTTKSAVVNVVGASAPNTTDGDQTGYSHQTCSNSYHTRAVDVTLPHSGATATVQFYTSLNNIDFGIRDVIITVWKCSTNCTTCTGYLATECTICSDGLRDTTLTAGTCTCKDNYYQQPYAGACVDPCPSVPIKYYGDNTTRNCVTSCPTGFAYDDLFRCWLDCPTTSPINSKRLYRDYTNKKCVQNCPNTQPYSDITDRKCYSVCPSPRYGANTTEKICVSTCPNKYLDSGIYQTYASGRYCVPYCPSGSWADPATATCKSPCTGTYSLKDDSTGVNRCVISCPPPNRFASSGSCIQICPTGQYGDVVTWQCTTMCTSPYYGLQSYNRKCVSKCPSNTWARNSSRTCVNTTLQCGPHFANDYSRQCVIATNCPYGTYADPTTYSCVTYCPTDRYGHPTTRVCELSCASPLFADPGVNLCVSTCITIGLYADVSTSRKCVSSCNQTGATPWADDSTRTCVSDCNQTVALYLADNTTWKCVYNCPLPLVADFTTTAPKCVVTCPTGWFADATPITYKICVQKCPANPPKFGDSNGGLNLCVDVCAPTTFGDQTGNRLCRKTCPTPYFAQNDDLRRCVRVCNATTYGWQETCTYHVTNCQYGYKRLCYQDPHSCPTNYFGDDSTQLCVNPCPASQVTFGDPLSKLCVRVCPDNPAYTAGSYAPQTYFADISNRQCVLTCSSTYNPPLFGNNLTKTCQSKCLDYNSYSEPQSTYRICVDRCWKLPVFFYANNLTKTCGNYMNCPSTYYGENLTQLCVQFCPSPAWGFRNAITRLCMDQCPAGYVGDDSTTKRICILVCPTVPDRYADLVLRVCVDLCNDTFYGYPVLRTCVPLCLSPYFSYQPTRRCLLKCPFGYFADDRVGVRKCQPQSSLCVGRFGDAYLKQCVSICTGPSPVDTFGSGSDCVSFCPPGRYADSYSASRLCVSLCPPGVLNSVAAPNLYGDPTTRRCVAKCVTPDTWADYQTRLCQPICSATPIPTFSQNFLMTCVTSLNCPAPPTYPTMTFGDTPTRSCVSFCSNNYWGDPTSRNCVSQCPNISTTGTSRYYGDSSTGQYLCVVICPSTPRLFGQNDTNLCVPQCPALTYGDQTGNRSCVPQCPLFGLLYYYAQNQSRICVLVCKNDTWGLNSSRQCVQNPFHCGSLWADDTTHMCVVTCPQISNLFGNFATRKCVAICPNGTYADDLTRTCVTRCPQNNGVHDTFGNNDTFICEQFCTQANAYADPQTLNRYCVTQCSQSPQQSFADPSTKSCVPRCPNFPNLFGQTQTYKCVSECASPYYADTHSRRCTLTCDTATQFKLRTPRLCVTLCPSSANLFGDPGTGFCQTSCSSGYRYAMLRICVPSCTTYGQFDYDGTCVKYCPYGYYADTNGHCVTPCPSATLFGENTTTTCESTCITGFAYNRVCLAICPDNLWGYNKVCQGSCPGATTASNVTNLCVGLCDAGTFNQNNICVTTCTTQYADPNTKLCSSSCTLGRYADPSTHTCVQVCPVGYYRDPSFTCKSNCAPLRADNLTNRCVGQCSNGTWGHNNLCISKCPDLLYGYLSDRDCYTIANIPDSTLFADNVTQTWVSQCSQNPLRFGDTQSHECVAACSSSTQYADPQSRKCETACTNSSYYRDPSTKTCVLICPVGYYANPQNGWCEVDCTLSRFNYDPTHFCVVNCPLPYFGYISTTNRQCVTLCPSPTFAEGDLCKTGCTLPLVADDTTRRCVSNCIDSFANTDTISCVAAADCITYSKAADNSTNRCVPVCPTDPDYYNQNGICVAYCITGTYSDPTAGLRICTSLCTEGLYGDPVSGRCVVKCLPGYFAFNDTNLCVLTCPNGFADNQTGVCVLDCPAPTFADSLNNKCMRICSNNQFGQGRLCVGTCSDTLYGNPITMQCQANCPSFDYSFAQNTTNMCVRNCSFVAGSYADRGNNYCMDQCSRTNQYALDVVGTCTSLCPQGQFMQNSTKKCQTGCTTGYAQPTSRFCVLRCFGNPQTFAHVVDKKCLFKCKTSTENLYADNNTNYCVAYNNCSRTPATFSDPISGHCVLFCPQGLYSQTTTYTCTDYCITGFADNFTRSCVSVCPQAQETYGDPNTHTCVKVCPDDWFANNSTQQCVYYDNCPTSSWSDIKSKHCVARCPSEPQYFGFDDTTSCVERCPSTPELYGDTVTQKCIWPCTNDNGQIRFADPISQTCVFVCPISQGLYGDPTTGKCTTSCHASNPFKDNSTQRCVAVCPSNPDYYAYSTDFTCVRVCPDGLYASDPTTRICSATCQPWLTFRDNTTNRCVSRCPIPYFADDSIYKCVLNCPSTPDYFADPHTRTCVPSCPIGPLDANGNPQWISWQNQVDRTCVTRCPTGYYAQNSSGRCTTQCPLNEYADPIIQVCVADCTVRPKYYKQGRLRTCVTQCPDTPIKAHKYEVDHVCVNMSGTVSGCPTTYFANQLNSQCTELCPSGYYADTHTKFCRLNCTNGQFADPVDRRCKTGCTTNPHWFAYSGDMTCVQYCPGGLYSQNVTWTCVASCPNFTNGTVLFSYQITRQCVIYCPIPYYAYIMTQVCRLDCPDGWYTNDETRTCVQACTGTYNADSSTNRCVQMCPTTPDLFALNNICIPSCPDGTFKDNSTRSCVTDCPYLPLTFADDSTNQCVEDCPSTPNYFADNQTRKCVSNCSEGTFADPSTRTCVQNCPSSPLTFADPLSWVCQPTCPSPNYASILTNQCVDLCPNLPIKTYAQDNGRVCTTRCMNGLFGNNDTRTCQANCLSMTNAYADITTNLCVTTCPIGFYAYDLTNQCLRACPTLFADNTTRKCVANCPGTQRLYADSTTQTCVFICPVGLYGDTDTWTCQNSCSNVASGYVLQVSRQCVAQCPSPYFALVSQRLCVENCGSGLYGNQVNRECQGCPNVCLTCLSLTNCLSCTPGLYLQFGACVTQCILNDQIANYANNVLMICASATRCPSGLFGNNGTKACESSCPTQMYGNSTTRTCQNCPQTCTQCINSTYCTACVSNAQLSTADYVCYPYCSNSLKYNYNGECYAACPPGSYLDFTNIYCQACNAICLTCEGNSLNCTSCDGIFKFENSCVVKCPTGYYGANSTCLACNDQIASCVQPLIFTTQTTVENYQQVIVIKFNQQTQINGKPQDFINVNLKVKRRRLADVANLVNNGIGFTSVVLPDGTIKLYIDPGVSLENVVYSVSFNNPSFISTASGATLQNLQELIQLAKAQVYPQQQTYKSPLVVAGKILAIIMLGLTFIMLLFGLTPLYLTIQAVQIMSLFAYTNNIAPNLFYFLKQLRLSRFLFIPSIFSSVYIEPTGYVPKIPQKVLDTQGHLSFALNGTAFIYFIFLYLLFGLIVFLFTSRVNSNRPLKNLFITIWETRIKFGVINDFIWLFSLNVLVQAFMQFRYTDNKSDLALAIIWGLAILAVTIGIFAYAIKLYRQDPDHIAQNYILLMQGTKQQWYHKFFIFIYNIRKILFAAILVSTVFSTMAMAAGMLVLFSLVGLAVLIVRPYKQHINNIALLLNEGFLGFFCGGVIYFLKMVQKGEPSGAKITNGLILTIIIMIHLCLMFSWSIYRSYIYLKQMRDSFKTTQFYKLYMDDEYDQMIEKQIIQLNQQDKGQVESIKVTNVAANDNKEGEEVEQGEEIIRLKIKRKIKKQKLNKKLHERDQPNKQNMKSGQYVKLTQNNEKYYLLKPQSESRLQLQKNYQKVIFDNKEIRQNQDRPNSPAQQKKQNQWVKIRLQAPKPIYNDQAQMKGRVKEELQNNSGYEQAKISDDIIDQLGLQSNIQLDKQIYNQSKVIQDNNKGVNNLQQLEEILINQDQSKIKQQNELQAQRLRKEQSEKQIQLQQKEREKERQRQRQKQKQKQKQQFDRKMRQTYKSSFADFDEGNFFQNQDPIVPNKDKKQDDQPFKNNNLKVDFQREQQQQSYNWQQEQNDKVEQDILQQPVINNNEDKNKQGNKIPIMTIKDNQLPSEISQIKFNTINLPTNKQEKIEKTNKQQQWQPMNSQNQSEQQIIKNNNNEQYKVFDFDQLDLQPQGQQKAQEVQDNKNKNNKKADWNVQVQQVDDPNLQLDQQEKKRKQKSKKMHLMLFEDEDEDLEQ